MMGERFLLPTHTRTPFPFSQSQPICERPHNMHVKPCFNQAVWMCLCVLVVACLTRYPRGFEPRGLIPDPNFLFRAIHLLYIFTCPNAVWVALQPSNHQFFNVLITSNPPLRTWHSHLFDQSGFFGYNNGNVNAVCSATRCPYAIP